MRATILAIGLLLSACASKPVFYGPPPFPEWMQRALANPNDNPAFHRFALAYHGDAAGLHGYFSEASRQANSSEMDAEASEGLSFELETIIRRVGDSRFSQALSLEAPEVRSAVRSFLNLPGLPAYPRSRLLLTQTPKIDFPLYRTYREDEPKVQTSAAAGLGGM